MNAIIYWQVEFGLPRPEECPKCKSENLHRGKQGDNNFNDTENDSGKDAMKDPRNRDSVSTGFLFCPRCELRKPKEDSSKYCPNCGMKMIEEGSVPYVPKSTKDKKDVNKNRIKEGNTMDRSDSIYGLIRQNQFNKSKNGFKQHFGS